MNTNKNLIVTIVTSTLIGGLLLTIAVLAINNNRESDFERTQKIIKANNEKIKADSAYYKQQNASQSEPGK